MPHGLVARRSWFTGAGVLLCIMISAVPGSASRILDPAHPAHATAIRAMEALHAGDPQGAHRFLAEYITAFPEDPIGPLLRMKFSWWDILEGRDQNGALDRRLQGDLTRVQTLAENCLKHDRKDVRALYALGEAYCTYGRLQGIRGAGWATLQNHRKGTPLLERALEIEPDLVEPLASLGVFHYYASRAPGFLRFLARFFSVQADRLGGLQQLQRAASEPGVQQAEAAFFLLEILVNVEDEQLLALPIALRFHQRYPAHLGFTIALANVQIALGRPDRAIHLFQEMTENEDPVRAISGRFFLARSLVMTGRPAQALDLLEGFTQSEFNRVTWLPAWHSYYLGQAYERLGRVQEAHRAYERTRATPVVADSHGYAERALERRPCELQDVLRDAEASLAWGTPSTDLRPRLVRALQAEPEADPDLRRRAHYAHALLSLREGESAAAAERLRSLVVDSDCDEAWLVVRPRIRVLQALLWSGRIDEARRVAQRLQPELNKWGSNRQLALLVANCLEPTEAQLASPRLQQPAGTDWSFGLKDQGFTCVRLRLQSHANPFPMRLRGDSWETRIALPPGIHLYHFEVEEAHPLPDPENLQLEDRAGVPWSLVEVPNASQALDGLSR